MSFSEAEFQIMQQRVLVSARQGMGAEAIQYCRSYALEAERRLGELLAQTERALNRPGPGRGKAGNKALPALTDAPPTLASLGLSKRESAEAQRLPWFEKEAKERGKQSGERYGRGKGKAQMPDPIQDKGQARDEAANAFGIGGRYVSKAKALKASSPQEFDVSSSAVDHRREAQAALDEQRRRPRWYPLTAGERLELEYIPDLAASVDGAHDD
jgi:hypothetical protein